MSATAEGSGACRVSRSSRPCPTCRRSPRVPCLEFSKVGFIYRENARSPGYYDGRYWTMWKLPMFGCTDSTQVYAELEEAKRLDANLPEKRAGARFLGRFGFCSLNLMERLFFHARGKIYIKIQDGSRILKDSHNSCFKERGWIGSKIGPGCHPNGSGPPGVRLPRVGSSQRS
ncbi:uncharacterized protein LOC112883790 isoform X3 [Panicum hallii]|uniref:uncharacterized protein LOC112883790 isoform X3 n=1 Tax=Panicum hallii TaxID=206008 RepID=UPI000DF4E964|nr:uncharacterized protein LOC112883790 isoform X3 [Panicum hallii]XP_025804795.1 uncharacterized protein LOC112883790 isoform X3 [Panicum hallii]XP_025804796.1 uncharacterized protein LOC112883790 isoform X3 [Panicum hallii]